MTESTNAKPGYIYSINDKDGKTLYQIHSYESNLKFYLDKRELK